MSASRSDVPVSAGSSARTQQSRPARIILTALTGVLAGFAVAIFVYIWSRNAADGNIGEDYRFYVDLGRRWLDTGVIYGDRQLTGAPYHVEIHIDNLYPPPAILLFAAFVFLPWFAWYLIPLALVGYTVWLARPAIWTWPLMALCILWPRTQGSLVTGNSDLWSAAFVAAGLVWGWPGVLGLFKPAFGLFALVGIRTRSWWIALGLAAVAAVLFAGYWPQYIAAASNWDLPITRSLANIPIVLLPIIAWIGRRGRSAGPGGPRLWRRATRIWSAAGAPATRHPVD